MPQLTEVQIIGKRYFHVFLKGGVKTEVACTHEEYFGLQVPNAPIPKMPGAKWVHSGEDDLYDSNDGRLQEGQYAVSPKGWCKAKVKGEFIGFPKEYFTDKQGITNPLHKDRVEVLDKLLSS